MGTALGAPTASTVAILHRKLLPFPPSPSSFSYKPLLPRRQQPQRRLFSFSPARADAGNGAGSGAGGGADSRRFDFDLFTIGAGSGGVRASRFAAGYGASVAICELPFATISSELAGGVGGT